MIEPDSPRAAGEPETSPEVVPTQMGRSNEATFGGDAAATASSASASPPPTLAIGSRLDTYELLEKLGEGGMGTVWKARHVKLDKFVALKVLPLQLTSDPEIVGRFEREMRAVGKVEHPHVVRAMDAREVGGLHFLVMEYVEGVDLSKHVKTRGPRSVADACVMARHAALGLAAAHSQGLIHRDVKPSNLLLSKQGQVKVLDLGLARLMTEGPEPKQLTQFGQVLGTPDYMAPEQWDDTHAVDHRADLYALGCTLYFLLTGRAPFGDDRHTTMPQKMKGHVLEAPPRLRDARPEVPEDLEDLYAQLMAKEPSQRLSSASEAATRLKEIVQRLASKSAPTRAADKANRTKAASLDADSAPAAATPTVTFMSDRGQVEALGAHTTTPAPQEAAPYRFGHACPLCGTRMDFESSQIGQTTTCPDCFTEFEVPAPGPRQARTPSSDDEFSALDRLDLEAPRDDSKRLDSPNSLKQHAELLLQKAARDLKSEEREQEERYGTFSDAAVRRFFEFMLAPATIRRIVLLSVMGSVALVFATMATKIDGESAKSTHGAIILIGAALTLGLWFAVLSAHALASLQNAAVRPGELENWPSANFLKWLGAPFQVGWAISIAAFPGFLLAALLTYVGLSAWLVGMLIPLSLIALLPIVLLSTLQSPSWFAVPSSEVWRQMRRASSATITFYQGATLMGIIAWTTLMATWFGQPLLAVPQAVILVLLTFLYFRLLGWLAHSMASVEED